MNRPTPHHQARRTPYPDLLASAGVGALAGATFALWLIGVVWP